MFVMLDERSVGRIVVALGFSHISVRPRNPRANEHDQEAQTLPNWSRPSSRPMRGTRLWWQDEARIGQQGSLTYVYVWAERGTGHVRRAISAIAGPISSARSVPRARARHRRGVGAGARQHACHEPHLAEIATQIAPGAHAVLIVDGAAWHKPGGRLHVPGNISLLPLPPYSPELNPTENVWQFCDKTSSATACSTATAQLSMHAAMPGTNSSPCRTGSALSAPGTTLE
jgi:hypothetical protein